MVVLDASRRNQRVPRLAQWSLGVGIVATVGANLAHGLGHGPVGVLVSAWPALALVGSYELLMLLIRPGHQADSEHSHIPAPNHRAPGPGQEEPSPASSPLSLAQTVQAWHDAGHSQRAIARELNIDRRKVRQIIERAA